MRPKRQFMTTKRTTIKRRLMNTERISLTSRKNCQLWPKRWIISTSNKKILKMRRESTQLLMSSRLISSLMKNFGISSLNTKKNSKKPGKKDF
jgi:hypothetical protein